MLTRQTQTRHYFYSAQLAWGRTAAGCVRCGIGALGLGALVLILSACGGGGGGSGQSTEFTSQVPAQATGSVSSSTDPQSLIAAVKAASQDLAQYPGLSTAQSSAQSLKVTPVAQSVSAQALTAALSAQAAGAAEGALKTAQSVRENDSNLCSSGSAWLTVSDALAQRLDASNGSDAAFRSGDQVSMDFGACTLGQSVFGPVLPAGSLVDGSAVLTFNAVNAPTFDASIIYHQFSLTLNAQHYGPLNAKVDLSFNGMAIAYNSVDTGTARYFTPSGVKSGSVITWQSGTRARVLVQAAGGYLDLNFKGWAWDTGTLSASQGQVLVTDAQGHQAIVAPDGLGGYTVSFL